MALLWSFPLWVAISAEAWFVTVAFGIDMPFSGTYLLQALLVIGVAVPTPGAVGSFHEAYRFGVTTFFGAPNDAAVAAGHGQPETVRCGPSASSSPLPSSW